MTTQKPLSPQVSPKFIQLAGHTTFGESKTPCIVVHKTRGTVLKLIQPPPRGQKELLFYRQLLSNREADFIVKRYKQNFSTDNFSDSGTSLDYTTSQTSIKSTDDENKHKLPKFFIRIKF